jgi:flagellar biosynthetic protein FliR
MTNLFDLDRILLFVLLLARATGLLMLAPFLGERAVPRSIKAFFALSLAFLMATFVPPLTTLPASLPALVLLAAAELSVGLSMGFLARLTIVAFEMAGQIISIQMGLAIAQVIDPMSGAQSSILSRWMGLLGIALFLTLDGHHHLLRALEASLELVPPGQGLLSDSVIAGLVELSGETLTAAMTLAAPVIGVLLLTSTGLGILARTVPQMNIFMVGFPIKIALGLAATVASLPYLIEVARRDVAALAGRLGSLLGGA